MDIKSWNNRLARIGKKSSFALGYKLLFCPVAVIETAKLGFISLNPAGNVPDGTKLEQFSEERGNSYLIEASTTKSPITDQFLKMSELLGINPQEILTGVAAPFRTFSWDEQSRDQKMANLMVGREIWSEIFFEARLERLIVCSQPATDMIVELTNARQTDQFLAGWGNIKIRLFRNAEGLKIVQIPHPSRFRLFGRVESQEPLQRALLE